jgi:hypothetical protein
MLDTALRKAEAFVIRSRMRTQYGMHPSRLQRRGIINEFGTLAPY